MSKTDPRPSFQAKGGEAEHYAKTEVVGTESCAMCGNPNTVGLGQFSPHPSERHEYALKDQDPSQIGTIFYPLCQDCANEAPGEQEEFISGIQMRLKYNAKVSKGK